ncbi:flagellar type III secretion system protein FliQ [Leptolyngbya sp. 15MV]|nr:flagellar type III secretion system protein FliQ [Leptolyngbya sp. 15MV]
MPYDEAAVMLVRDTLIMVLKVAAPILLAGVAIGLMISILQAVTQIQDQTITFVPKIVVMLVAAVLLLPWIAARLVEYTASLLTFAGGV